MIRRRETSSCRSRSESEELETKRGTSSKSSAVKRLLLMANLVSK